MRNANAQIVLILFLTFNSDIGIIFILLVYSCFRLSSNCRYCIPSLLNLLYFSLDIKYTNLVCNNFALLSAIFSHLTGPDALRISSLTGLKICSRFWSISSLSPITFKSFHYIKRYIFHLLCAFILSVRCV